MKILFMGTPLFAVNVLDKIYQKKYDDWCGNCPRQTSWPW